MSTPSTLLPRLADLDTSSSSNARRPSQIESYGVHCQEPTCNLSDFLPFKCQFCSKSYCSSHRLPFSHSCDQYDEEKYDNRVKLCQFCQEPLKIENIPQNTIDLDKNDINVLMEYHITSGDCSVLKDIDENGLFKDKNGRTLGEGTGKKKVKNEKKCRYWKCKNIMWVEMKCPQCGQSFCPTHREARSHKCGEQDPSTSSRGNHSSSSSVNNVKQAGRSSNMTSMSSAAFMKVNPSNTSNKSSGTKSSPNIPQNPFSKLSLSTSKSKNDASHIIPTSTQASSKSTGNNDKPPVKDVIGIIKGKTTSNVNDMSTSRRAAREREQAAMALKNRAKKG